MSFRLAQVSDNLVFVGTEYANWIIAHDDSGVTLIDGGYPLQRPDLEASLASTGHAPQDVRAILITHAHRDHVGAVGWMVEDHGTPVYSSAIEAAHLRGEFHESIGAREIVLNAWRPRFARWTRDILRLIGERREPSFPTATGFPHAGQLSLPGNPIPVATHGHTSGHVGYYFPGEKALATGDALVTGHPTSRVTGPQLLPHWFQHEQEKTARTLSEFRRFDVDVVLPGHGPLARGPVGPLIDEALAKYHGPVASRWT